MTDLYFIGGEPWIDRARAATADLFESVNGAALTETERVAFMSGFEAGVTVLVRALNAAAASENRKAFGDVFDEAAAAVEAWQVPLDFDVRPMPPAPDTTQ